MEKQYSLNAKENRHSHQFREKSVPVNKICTRFFIEPRLSYHYDFAKCFFEKGESHALNNCDYTTWLPVDQDSLFLSLPTGLQTAPVWWRMPWGGFNKLCQNEISIATIAAAKHRKLTSFIELLRSVEKQGLSHFGGTDIPVHELVWGRERVYIQHGGHHRIATLAYLHDQGAVSMINSFELCPASSSPTVKVDIRITMHREWILDLDSVGDNDTSHFPPEDAFRWFEHPFSIIGARPLENICIERNDSEDSEEIDAVRQAIVNITTRLSESSYKSAAR